MINIAIVDDEPTFSVQVGLVAGRYLRSNAIDYKIKIYEFSKDLLDDIEEDYYYDIYLLDIEMPIVNGMKLAYEIRQKNDNSYIMFITSYLEYCIKGYEYNAWRYITKNRMEEMLITALDDLLDKLREREDKIYIIELHSRIYKFSHNDIYYLHKAGKYTEFHTKQGFYRERKPINKVLKSLNNDAFIVTDRSYVVNLYHVITLERRIIMMRNGDEVPVSLSQLSDVMHIVTEFWRDRI